MQFKQSSNYQSQTDETLMVAVHYGDNKAFNELYQRYKNRLLYYFYRMLGNSQEKAQDFLQEIFLKVIEKPELFDPKRKFSTWIFSIAHNMCKNEYRRLKVREIVSRDENIDFHSEESDDLKEEQKLLTDLIFKEIDLLEETEKTAFLLRYREGFALKEISTILDLPEGTIKSKLFYTRKKLLAKFQVSSNI